MCDRVSRVEHLTIIFKIHIKVAISAIAHSKNTHVFNKKKNRKKKEGRSKKDGC